MIVVLAVLALVAGLIVLRGPQGSATLSMRAATSMVAGGLRVARSQAIARNRPVPLRFAADGAALQVGDGPAQALPAGIRMVAGARTIVFRPDGSSSGGKIELAGEARAAALTVNWLTGRVSETSVIPADKQPS